MPWEAFAAQLGLFRTGCSLGTVFHSFLRRPRSQQISMAGQSLNADLGLHVARHRCQTIVSLNIMQNHRVNHVSSADLVGSSKYSYETYEDKVKSGKWFHDNSLF
jgi:hypothetical protein